MSEDFKKDIDEAYAGIFVESKLYKSKATVEKMDLQDVAEYTYLNFLALWIMFNEPLTAASAMAYADRTASFGNFKKERNMATDLYVSLHTLINDGSTVAKTLHNLDGFDKLRINQQYIKSYLDDMASDRVDMNDTARFMMKLERMLNIRNSNYKTLRRDAQEWPALNPHARNVVMVRLQQYFNRHARRSELKPMLDELALASGYSEERIQKLDNTDKLSVVKALAAAAAGLYGGYQLGKSLINVKSLLK